MTLTFLRRTTTALLVVVATSAIAAAGLHDSAVGTVRAERAALAFEPEPGSAVAVAAAPAVTATEETATATSTTTSTVVAPREEAAATAAPEPTTPTAPRRAAPATTAAPASTPTPTTVPPASPPAPATATNGTRDPACESNMVRWMNEVRAAHRLVALADDRGIQSIPVNWSDGMAGRQHLAHNPRYGEQIFAARPQAVTAGENVGRGTGDRAIFDGFMASAGHRGRILDRANTYTTVGCLRDSGGVLWVTVNFWG